MTMMLMTHRMEIGEAITDGDPESKMLGAAAGQITSETVENALDGKIGEEGAEVVGAIAGKVIH